MKRIKRKQAGFTFIELMITVAIVAVLASIALPSYSQYVIRGKRTEGRSMLLDAAALQERYYSDNNQFAALTTVGINTTSENSFYTLTMTLDDGNNQSFTLTADPQFDDAECDNLSYTNAGAKGENGTSDVSTCWGK